MVMSQKSWPVYDRHVWNSMNLKGGLQVQKRKVLRIIIGNLPVISDLFANLPTQYFEEGVENQGKFPPHGEKMFFNSAITSNMTAVNEAIDVIVQLPAYLFRC